MRMRISIGWRPAIYLAAAAMTACSPAIDRIGAPHTLPGERAGVVVAGGGIVISQLYGGGGNSGSTYKNDFIELYNAGSTDVSVNDWSVQYASATGTTWAVTVLSGTIAPGRYYLVQEAAGTAGTTALPAPDATGTIAMSATAAKVALVNTTTALTGACPIPGATVVDFVGFGTTANCFEGSSRAPAPSNTTAALRKADGAQDTNDNAADFATGAPTPRNSATGGTQPAGPLDHVVITGVATVSVGGTTQLTASAQDASNRPILTATFQWSTSDANVATVDQTGKVTGVAESATPATITVVATDNGITVSGSQQVTVQTPTINWADVSTTTTSFPAGFQSQIFFTARTAQGGAVIPATFAFESLNPEIATIANAANTGIITAVAPPADGTTKAGFRVTATPVGGGTPYVFTTRPITVEVPVFAPTTIYAKNDEFGDPSAASTSNPNDLLIVRPQYTVSYNESRGTPNWVSYELDSRQMVVGQDRCNCFTADPNISPARQILTSDYTNGGYDRGHMTRSADRTAANADNATTFYLSNVVPQQADLNQGVWAQFENALADSASRSGRAVYIITGPLYSRTRGLVFLKNEGKVAIPDSTWKVAFIGPRYDGVPFDQSTVLTWGQLAGTTVLAVNMPNVAGVRNDPWAKYLTTVDKIEESTGLDFLNLVPVAFQTAVEASDRSPVARVSFTGATTEGSTLVFDASASTDPDLGRTDLSRTEALSYAWYFSDGTSATGIAPSKTFTRYGTFKASLTVTDAYGWQSYASQVVTIANVTPVVAPLADATLSLGQNYTASGSFADPGANKWTATVEYGDGSGSQPLLLSGKTFALSHAYASAGTYTVTVSINDRNATGTASATVAVQAP